MKKQTKEVECEKCLVVKDMKFFVERLDAKRNLITLPVTFTYEDSYKYLVEKLYRNYNSNSGRFPLRRLTQEEQTNIQNSDMHRCPDVDIKEPREPEMQKMLDRLIENTLILDLNEIRDKEVFERQTNDSIHFMEASWIFEFT